jgi:hypothetical protein
MTDVSGNLLANTTYTISSTGTITYDVWVILAAQAAEQISLDDPSGLLSAEQSNVAQAYFVAHLIQLRQGLGGKISESGIGRYGYSRGGNAGLTAWLDMYHGYLKGIQDAPVDLTSSTYTDGITRDDKNMNGLGLDQSPPYDLDNESRSDE